MPSDLEMFLEKLREDGETTKKSATPDSNQESSAQLPSVTSDTSKTRTSIINIQVLEEDE